MTLINCINPHGTGGLADIQGSSLLFSERLATVWQ